MYVITRNLIVSTQGFICSKFEYHCLFSNKLLLTHCDQGLLIIDPTEVQVVHWTASVRGWLLQLLYLLNDAFEHVSVWSVYLKSPYNQSF